MDAHAYFEQNAAKAGQCKEFPVVEARKVKAGEKIIVTSFVNFSTTAPESGWEVEYQRNFRFLNDEEFKAFKQVDIVGTEKLPDGAKVVAVKKGQTIVTQPWSDTTLGVQAKADSDGFLVTLPDTGKTRFMSASAFRAAFESSAAAPTDQGFFQYIPTENDPAVPFVVLDKPMTFDFKAGAYDAPAGSVLYKNEEDEDGYTLVSAEHFAQNFTVVKQPAAAPAPAPKTPKT